MHEFSLAQSLMNVVAESAQAESITHISRVTVVVGEWTAVLPDALAASFALLAEAGVGRPDGAHDLADAGAPGPGQALFRGAELVIVCQPASGICVECGEDFAASAAGLICPRCGGAARLKAGHELYVDSYEGE